ncbi:MAG TPA: hypothetical protein VMW54_01825 [Terriglobia bacterium]|nr:hypothetical protein [Terriglobia bacterium]
MISPAKLAAEEATLGMGSQEQPTNRWVAILYIAFCFEMGVFLFVFPWVPVWHHNFFVARYEWLSALSRNYYVRGAISGIGLVDVFLSFYELWRMRASLGLVRSRPAR